MVHKEQYQRLADEAAMARGGYALHIGKTADDTFVYSLRPSKSADFEPTDQTLIAVNGEEAKVVEGAEAEELLSRTVRREFATGRAIFNKYRTLVRNQSAVIGEGAAYARAIVEALDSKALKASTLYQYLEIADHYRKKLHIAGSDIVIC